MSAIFGLIGVIVTSVTVALLGFLRLRTITDGFDMETGSRVSVVREANRVVFSWPWLTSGYVASATFIAILLSILLAIAISAATDRVDQTPAMVLNIVLLPLLLPLAYWMIAAYLNTTVVQVDNGALSASHGPVPWPGNRTVSAGTVDCIRARPEERMARDATTTFTYGAYVVLAGGQEVRLLSWEATPDIPNRLATMLADSLGVPHETTVSKPPQNF